MFVTSFSLTQLEEKHGHEQDGHELSTQEDDREAEGHHHILYSCVC